MSTIARQGIQRPAVERKETPRTLAIRWEISPWALLVSRGAGMLNGHAAKLRSCSLVIELGADTARAFVDLTLAGGDHSRLELVPEAPLVRHTELGLECVEAAGVIEATIRDCGDEPELLYTRTPLLERTLGLSGGVYDGPAITFPASSLRP
jgi:hypothetical protein